MALSVCPCCNFDVTGFAFLVRCMNSLFCINIQQLMLTWWIRVQVLALVYIFASSDHDSNWWAAKLIGLPSLL